MTTTDTACWSSTVKPRPSSGSTARRISRGISRAICSIRTVWTSTCSTIGNRPSSADVTLDDPPDRGEFQEHCFRGVDKPARTARRSRLCRREPVVETVFHPLVAALCLALTATAVVSDHIADLLASREGLLQFDRRCLRSAGHGRRNFATQTGIDGAGRHAEERLAVFLRERDRTGGKLLLVVRACPALLVPLVLPGLRGRGEPDASDGNTGQGGVKDAMGQHICPRNMGRRSLAPRS